MRAGGQACSADQLRSALAGETFQPWSGGTLLAEILMGFVSDSLEQAGGETVGSTGVGSLFPPSSQHFTQSSTISSSTTLRPPLIPNQQALR